MRSAEWKKLVIHNVLARLSGAYKLPRPGGGYFSRPGSIARRYVRNFPLRPSFRPPKPPRKSQRSGVTRKSTARRRSFCRRASSLRVKETRSQASEIPEGLQRGFGRESSNRPARRSFNYKTRAISRGRDPPVRVFLIQAGKFIFLSRFLLSRACRKRRPVSPVRKQARAVPLPPLEWSMAPVPITRTSGTAPA